MTVLHSWGQWQFQMWASLVWGRFLNVLVQIYQTFRVLSIVSLAPMDNVSIEIKVVDLFRLLKNSFRRLNRITAWLPELVLKWLCVHLCPYSELLLNSLHTKFVWIFSTFPQFLMKWFTVSQDKFEAFIFLNQALFFLCI